MSVMEIHEVAKEIGLPELANIDGQEFIGQFMPASAIGLSEDDITGMHEPYTDSRIARLYGGTFFNDGLVAQRVLEAAIRNGRQPGPIYTFQGLVAEYCKQPDNTLGDEMSRINMQIFPEGIQIDQYAIVLPKMARLVIDYTAGLSSRSLVHNQMNFVAKGIEPFGYIPITRTHFNNLMIMGAYYRYASDDNKAYDFIKKVFKPIEAGIASATETMVEGQLEGGVQTDVADLVYWNGYHRTHPLDLRKGAENAFKLVQDEGVLIVRSFAKPSNDEIGTDEIADEAFQAGFSEEIVLDSSTVSPGKPVSPLQASISEDREMKTLVLTK